VRAVHRLQARAADFRCGAGPRAGKGALVADIVKRLRCSKCGGRYLDVMIVGIPR